MWKAQEHGRVRAKPPEGGWRGRHVRRAHDAHRLPLRDAEPGVFAFLPGPLAYGRELRIAHSFYKDFEWASNVSFFRKNHMSYIYLKKLNTIITVNSRDRFQNSLGMMFLPLRLRM